MLKKTTAIITILLFALVSGSCVVTKMKSVETIKPGKTGDMRVLAVVTKTGKWIEFEKSNPAKVQKDTVVGQTRDESGNLREIVLHFAELAKVLYEKTSFWKGFARGLGIFGVIMWGNLIITGID